MNKGGQAKTKRGRRTRVNLFAVVFFHTENDLCGNDTLLETFEAEVGIDGPAMSSGQQCKAQVNG